ncbi:MAG: hypothetical protein FWH55_05475, partial [Oscillospiraceae bacterium]|nr:hypothetical protein [Oscillospiraceae bacterium]
AAIYAGFITGNDGFINPTSFITRAEAVVLLDRIRLDARVFGFPGIYGPASGVYSIMGDVTITSSEVTLRNFEFQQNIHITSNVSDGVITIMNSQLSGGMYVEGGGPGGVHLINSLIEGAAIFKDGIRVLLSDGALIGIMYVESERVRVVLDNDAIIEGLGIFADQVSIDVSESAYAVEIYIEANNTTISGTGKIDHVIVEGGQGNVVTVSGAFVEVGDNAGPVDFGDGNATSSRDADMNDEASDINDLDNTSDSENNENPVDAENVENVVNTDDADDGTNTGD